VATQPDPVTPHPIDALLTWVKNGETVILESQRSFVWKATSMCILIDGQQRVMALMARPLMADPIRPGVAVS
jgi:hypothetical protein